MSPTKKPPPAPDVDEVADDGFVVRRVKVRNQEYVLKELSAGQYERCLKLAREDKEDADSTLFKLMLEGSIIEPKGITIKKLYDGPFTVVQRLNEIIREMHFVPADFEEDEDDDKGEVKEG